MGVRLLKTHCPFLIEAILISKPLRGDFSERDTVIEVEIEEAALRFAQLLQLNGHGFNSSRYLTSWEYILEIDIQEIN